MTIRVVFSKLFAMFRRRAIEEDFDAEVRAHLEMLIEENVRRGMAEGEARRVALHRLGGITQLKETLHEQRALPQIENLIADLKYGLRTLRANPGFTLIAVLTLTLGIGVTTTIFTAYDSIALKPLPVADPGHVVRLERWFQSGAKGDIQYAFSLPEYEYCRDRNDVFTSMVATSWPLEAIADGSEEVLGQLVSANYFRDMGVGARVGRVFLPEEDRAPVIVISHAFWQRRFNGEAILGRSMNLNGTVFTIAGVAAKEFTGTGVIPQIPDFWAPLSSMQQGVAQVQILGRLKSKTTIEKAAAQTTVLIGQIALKETDRTTAVTVQRTAFLGNTEDPGFQAAAWAIMLIVGMVLLVGCVNIANMLLARGAARQKEISVRLALGASRGRIVRQLLTENLLLSVMGGIGGLLMSIWAGKLLWLAIERLIHRMIGPEIALAIDFSPDGRVVACAIFLSVLAGLLFGLSPALQFSRPDLTSALKDEGSFGARWSRSRVRGLLVAMQVTVSMVLLISAGLLLRGLSRAQIAEPGFETASVYRLYGGLGGDAAKATAMQLRLRDRLQTLPELKSVAIGTLPLLGTWTPPMIAGEQRGRTLASYASDTYFELLSIPLVRGRTFTRPEAERGAAIAVVSESTVRAFWPGEDPIGRHFTLDMNFRGNLAQFEVIGVVKDVRFASLSRIDPAHVYLAASSSALLNSALLVRSQTDFRRAAAAIRSAAAKLDPRLAAGLSMMNLETGPVQFQRSFAQISALSATILAALALALAGVGIYGVMSYVVSQRVKEIGVRVALGARAGDVLLAVVAQGLRPVFFGIALGMSGAAGLSAFLHSTLSVPGASDLLYGIPFYDPATFVGLPLFLLTVACSASAIPARRALHVDPMVALRYE